VGGQPANFLSLAIDPVTPSTVYGGTGGQILKSINGALSWQRATAGMPVLAVWALAIDPLTPSTLYAGTQSGTYKSTDAGVSCAAANSGLTALKGFAVAVDPTAPSTLYVGGNAGLFKSVDGGKSWTYIPIDGLPAGTPVFSLAILPGSTAIMAATNGGGFLSKDGGATWTANLGLIAFAFAVDPKSPSNVYAVGGAGPSPDQLTGAALNSTDGGSTWSVFASEAMGSPIFDSVVVDPRSQSAIIVGTDAGIYTTFVHPSGRLELVTNGALASRVVYALVLDPTSPSTLWAGTDNGLFRSTDTGMTFTQVTSGMTATGVYVLLFDPASSSTVYAGTNAGVFQSTNRGASWAPINLGLTNLLVNALALGSGGALYAATNGSGVFLLTDELETREPVRHAKLPEPPRHIDFRH
jgi:photosystem II stability/assembly factor-like uncharacterized protein